MKNLLLVAIALLVVGFVGCAKTNKEVKFVPLQISWNTAEGVDSDAKEVSACMVQVTNALMSHELVQKHSEANISYDAEIAANGELLKFKGVCPADEAVVEELCSWTVDCDAKGSVTNLKFGK